MTNGDKWLNLLGLFLLFLLVFLAVSFLTYSPSIDPPSSTASDISNAGGILGAYLSHYIFLTFGSVSWILLGWLGLAVSMLFLQAYDFFGWESLGGWLAIVLGASGFLAVLNSESHYFLPDYLLYRTEPLLGPVGSILSFTFLIAVGIVFQPLKLYLDVLQSLRNGMAKLFSWLSTASERSLDFSKDVTNTLRTAVNNVFDREQQAATTAGPTETSGAGSSEQSTTERTDTEPDASEETDSDEKDTDGSEKVIPFNKDDKETDEETDDKEADSEKKSTEEDTKSPEDTEKTKSSDPVEVSEDRPEVDEADMSKFRMPDFKLLEPGEIKETIPDDKTLSETSRKLEETFDDFGLEGEVVDVNPGPVLTMYEVEPGAGVSVKKFESRADDIKLNLAVESVRIVSPIPGKSALGIEVPNEDRALVRLRDVLSSEEFQSGHRNLPLGLGLDVLGDPMIIDLADLPHLLVAGATGSGKSVGLNAMICSLLYELPPDELKFIMIDPKRVELSLYDGLPHLMTPVIDDTSEATKVLKWAVKEMENRYETLSEAGMRDIASYNEKVAGKDGKDKIPYLVILVDELSDLMLTNPKECEKAITRLAQMARAVGIHMVLATQRPSTDVITGLIKANMPARLAFRVSSGTDSRVILDENGAETLLGNGDLLYLSAEEPHPVRGQGSFLSDEETKDLIRFAKEQVKPSYVDKDDLFGSSSSGNFDETMDDEYYDEAKELVIERQKASASMLQRRFRVGYNRAARMIDAMEEEGVVGPHRGSKARNVLVDKEEYADNEGE